MCAKSPLLPDVSEVANRPESPILKQQHPKKKRSRKAAKKQQSVQISEEVSVCEKAAPVMEDNTVATMLRLFADYSTSYRKDILAEVVDKQRVCLEVLYSSIERLNLGHWYRIIMGTTQAAHVVVFMAMAATAMLIYPSHESENLESQGPSQLARLIYLVTFMTHFGSQMWMTFVSGLTLYFNMPRHTFGEVQKVLFPRYFEINTILSFITLAMFVRTHPSESWDVYIMLQVAAMVLCFMVELVIRIYFAPPLVRLITARNEIESEAGIGTEVGRHNPGDLAKCPHYMGLHTTFRRVHMVIAIGNMTTMACTTFHLSYLANKIYNI